EYDSFSIESSETVEFHQPSQDSIVLNRVIGDSSSNIFGSLLANGQIFLVNSNGVVFGENSSVNTGALLVSTLDISDDDFFSGNYDFELNGNAGITNNGSITVDPNGFIAFLAPDINNTGALNASNGSVVLLSANQISVGIASDGSMTYSLNQRLSTANINNSGTIKAGEVVLGVNAADQVLDTVINNGGRIEATGISNDNGIIRLISEGGGEIKNNGTLNALNQGTIEIKGNVIENNGQINTGSEGTVDIDETLENNYENEEQEEEQVEEQVEEKVEEETIATIQIEAIEEIILTESSEINADHGEIEFDSEGDISLAGDISTIDGIVDLIAEEEIIVEEKTTIEGDVTIQAKEDISLNNDLNVKGALKVEESTFKANDKTLTVSGDLNLETANFESGTSTVILDDSSKITNIFGDNTFYNFSCLTPAKILAFAADSKITILNDFHIQGGYAEHVKLVSSMPGEEWFIDPQGQRDLTYTWVEDSYNLNPETIIMTESTNRDNSFNWDPDGYWTNGNATGIWSDPLNWAGLGGATPGAGDHVYLDGTSSTPSLIDAAFTGTIYYLIIDTGYASTLTTARDLTIIDDFVQVTGTFDVNNNISVGADINITGGTFNHNAGVLTLDTSVSRNIWPGATTFNDVTISAGSFANIDIGGTLDVDGDLTITQVRDLTGGIISVEGNVITTDTNIWNGAGDTIIRFDGNNNQTLSASGGSGAISGIEINKTGNTLTIQDNIMIDDAGFTYTQGTVDTGTSMITFIGDSTIDSGPVIFNDVTFDASTFSPITITGVMDIDGDLTIVEARDFSNGIISVEGDVTTTDTDTWFGAGDTVLRFDGNNDQTLSASGGSGAIPGLEINKTGNTLTIQDNIIIDQAGFNYTQGTVDTGTSQITFIGDATIDSGPVIFNDVSIDASSWEDITINGGLDVDGDFSISEIDTLNGTISVAGNFTNTDSAVNGNASYTLDGTGNQIIDTNNNDMTSGTFTINKPSGTATLASNFTLFAAGQDLIVSNGTLDLNGNNLTIPDAVTFVSNTTLELHGGETISSNTLTIASGTNVSFTGDGDGNLDIYTITDYFTTYENLNISSSDNSDVFEFGADLALNGNLTIQNGILDLNGYDLTGSLGTNFSNEGVFRLEGGETITNINNDIDSGTIYYDGTNAYPGGLAMNNDYFNLTFDGEGGYWQAENDVTVYGTFLILNGTFDINGYELIIINDTSQQDEEIVLDENVGILDENTSENIISLDPVDILPVVDNINPQIMDFTNQSVELSDSPIDLKSSPDPKVSQKKERTQGKENKLMS
ncbi:hypothetical protein BVX93_01170, partial [bacterium B13(2017)]